MFYFHDEKKLISSASELIDDNQNTKNFLNFQDPSQISPSILRKLRLTDSRLDLCSSSTQTWVCAMVIACPFLIPPPSQVCLYKGFSFSALMITAYPFNEMHQRRILLPLLTRQLLLIGMIGSGVWVSERQNSVLRLGMQRFLAG